MTGLVFMKHHSERVPRKNLRDVGGRPLYQWIFETLFKSRFMSGVILNTDSVLIAEEVTRHFPPVSVHMRPEHLLTIRSNEANQIIEYDIGLLDSEHFVQTHSTNPLLSVETLDSAISTYFDTALPAGHDSLFSVTPHQKRFYGEDGQPINHDPDLLIQTQSLSPLLEENSCVYLFSRTSFGKASHRIGARPYLFPMTAHEALDIDTEDDLVMADLALRARAAARD